MPVRNMLYDALQYSSEIQSITRSYRREQKAAKEQQREPLKKLDSDTEFLSGLKTDDRLLPVMTLVIYYGADPWTGPRTLHELLDWNEANRRFQPYIADYRLNLIEPFAIRPDDFSRLTTELRQILEFMKYSADEAQLLNVMKTDEGFRYLNRQTTHVIYSLTGIDIPRNNKREEENMGTIIENLINKAVQKKEAELNSTLREHAKEMLADGLSSQQVIRYTGLTESEVAQLAQSSDS